MNDNNRQIVIENDYPITVEELTDDDNSQINRIMAKYQK